METASSKELLFLALADKSSRYVQSINTIALKMVKVSKLVQMKVIPYRSNIGRGHFERLRVIFVRMTQNRAI